MDLEIALEREFGREKGMGASRAFVRDRTPNTTPEKKPSIGSKPAQRIEEAAVPHTLAKLWIVTLVLLTATVLVYHEISRIDQGDPNAVPGKPKVLVTRWAETLEAGHGVVDVQQLEGVAELKEVRANPPN